jgi:hypothetical protein
MDNWQKTWTFPLDNGKFWNKMEVLVLAGKPYFIGLFPYFSTR